MYGLLVYLGLCLLATPLHATIHTFLLYGALSAAVIGTIGTKIPEYNTEKVIKKIVFIPAGLYIAMRLIPFIEWGQSALGADIGAYYGNFNACFASFFACSKEPLALLGYLLHSLYANTQLILIAMHLVMALALFIGVYRITKAEWGIQAALWSAFIYAISLPQFLFYWSFFLKMEASIVASLFAMHAYAKKEWRAAIYAALAGIAHPLPIVPLVMAFMITSITNKDARRGFYTSLAGIAGTLIFNGNALKGYSAYVAAYTRGTYAPAAEQFLAGHFVGFSFYHDALMLFYVPFALISLSWCITKNKIPIIGWYALINLALISVNAAFHNRFIILFDISCIILSGHAFAVFTHKQQKNKVNRILFITAIAFLAVYSLRQSARMEPLVTDAEFNELISMQGNYSTMPLFINSSTYRQFVAGYTNHPVILSSFNDEPWKSLKTASLIYNARRSTPINPKNNSHITQISERFFKYIP